MELLVPVREVVRSRPDLFGTLMTPILMSKPSDIERFSCDCSTLKLPVNDSYWENKRLKDIHHDLDTMFEDVLDEAKKTYADNDLGRVVIHHPSLNDAIVVPLQSIHQLNKDDVLQTMENGLVCRLNWWVSSYILSSNDTRSWQRFPVRVGFWIAFCCNDASGPSGVVACVWLRILWVPSFAILL
jgi:hypothetical protein